MRLKDLLPRCLMTLALLGTGTARAVTCDFDYQLTPPPHGVGVRTVPLEPGHAIVWYPAEHSTWEAVTDEREPGRVNLRDYVFMAHWGQGFGQVDLAELVPYMNARYQGWQARGATQVSLTHMMAARMHARIDAPPVAARGVVIGSIDPILAETLAGHGLVVASLVHPILEPEVPPPADLATALARVTATIEGFDALPKAWLSSAPQDLAGLATALDAIDVDAITLLHRLDGKAQKVETDAALLAFVGDTGKTTSRAPYKALKAAKSRYVTVTGFEDGIVAVAPYEACARRAFSETVHQGLPLHKRRTATRAMVLEFLEDTLDIDLRLEGTDRTNQALVKEVGFRESKAPPR